MKVLALDPGETLGVALLDATSKGIEQLKSAQVPLMAGDYFDLEVVSNTCGILLQDVDVIVLEDYRVFISTARTHIGKKLLTSELIGMIELLAYQANLKVIRVQPNQKGRWPEARMKAKLPFYKQVVKPHGVAALQIALVFLEKQLNFKF